MIISLANRTVPILFGPIIVFKSGMLTITNTILEQYKKYFLMNNPRILIISSLANSLVNFRGDLIVHLIREGFEVFCAAPEFENPKTEDTLKGMGATTLTYPLERNGLNPIKDLRSIRTLKQMMRKHKIDLVFPYTIKPVIYGSIAARQLGIPVVSLITGLGFTFSGINIKAKIITKPYRNTLSGRY